MSELKMSEASLSLSHVRLFVIPGTIAHQAPLTMGFSRQEYWSGLPCPPPGNHPNSGMEAGSLALQTDSLPSEPPGKSYILKFPTDIGWPVGSCLHSTLLRRQLLIKELRGPSAKWTKPWRPGGQATVCNRTGGGTTGKGFPLPQWTNAVDKKLGEKKKETE